MAPIRLTAPSFKLKKSTTAVFSPTGRYLAQIGPRVFVWDISRREVLSAFKVIANECHLAFSFDEDLLAVKSTNGEVVFVNVATGTVRAKTGRYSHYQEGCRPQFLTKQPLLLDGDWNGVLRLFDANSANEVSRWDFTSQYMVSDIVSNISKQRFVVALNAKHDQPGGSRLLTFQEPLHLDQPQPVLPRNEAQCREGGWRHIERLAMHPNGSKVAVALLGSSPHDPNTIELVDLTNSQSLTIPLPSRMHFVRGMSWSASGILAVSIYENLHKRGQSLAESIQQDRVTAPCHVCFHSDSSAKLIARWPWKDAWGVEFSPPDDALVVASSDIPGAYMANKALQPTGLAFGSAGG